MKIGEEQLKGAPDADMRVAADRDIFIAQESGKMHIKDLEQDEADKDARRLRRRKDGYGVDEDTDSDDEKGSSTHPKGQSANALRKLIKSQKASKGASSFVQRKEASSGISKKRPAARSTKTGRSGHFEKHSGDRYTSAKGKGDVLKAGEHEPFSYIQLNPRLLNKRHRQQAVNSFKKVVSFGKKADKRSGSS